VSALTRCNYCTLEWIKARAAREGDRVIVVGTYVFIRAQDDDRELDPREPDAWFGMLTTHCVC
jgi:hypothetical protein